MATPELAAWFRTELRAAVSDLTAYRRQQSKSLAKRQTELATMQDRLLNAYLAGTVDEAVYKAKSHELKAEAARAEEALAQLGDVDPAGRGKTDRDAYEAALAAWEKKKAEIDAQTPKPHEPEYLQAIATWELVLTWSRRHHDESMAAIAAEKLELLRRKLGAKKPEPLLVEDTFKGRFSRDDHGQREVYNTLMAAVGWEADRPLDPSAKVVDPRKLGAGIDEPDPLLVEKAVWTDRLAVMQRGVPEELTLGLHVERFLADKSASVAAGEISLARVYSLRLHLEAFADWAGRTTPVIDVSGKLLSDYRRELLSKVNAGEWSATTANDRLGTVKSLVRWLWHTEAIPTLPRILDGKSNGLRIGKSQSQVVVFTPAEISTLLKEASDRTRLYILPMLNTGMTQKDISDLQHAEVDWVAGRIVRKRSKTRKHENVPTVEYVLWPETLRLLTQERSEDGAEAVLLNAGGERLLLDKIGEDGKYKKNDNVRSAFARLSRKTKINKPLKSLKKTSASLIRANPRFRGLEDLFLGHAAAKLSDKHYTLAPQQMLDEAIKWLRDELEINDAMKPTSKSTPPGKKRTKKNTRPAENASQSTS